MHERITDELNDQKAAAEAVSLVVAVLQKVHPRHRCFVMNAAAVLLELPTATRPGI